MVRNGESQAPPRLNQNLHFWQDSPKGPSHQTEQVKRQDPPSKIKISGKQCAFFYGLFVCLFVLGQVCPKYYVGHIYPKKKICYLSEIQI